MTVDGAAAVGHSAAAGVPALDNALEALTLADAGHVDVIALGKGVGLDLVAHVHLGGLGELELLEHFLHGDFSLLQVTLLRLGELPFRNVLEAQLYGVVAVLLLGLLLHHDAGTCFDHSDRDDLTGFVKDLGHTDLSADDGLFHVGSPP